MTHCKGNLGWMRLHYLMSTKKVIKDLRVFIHRHEASFTSYVRIIFYQYLEENNSNVFGEIHL